MDLIRFEGLTSQEGCEQIAIERQQICCEACCSWDK